MKKTLKQWLEWQEKLHLSEIDLGLDRIRHVAKKLNLLTPTFPIITVAGTNGKGSSVAFLDAILKAEGYKTGSFTSPHLIEYNERIQLNNKNTSDQEIINAFELIDNTRGNTSLTYFEFGTLAAMLIFDKNKVDVAILEVGLGGRLDAANVWDASLALITSIDIDHTDWLGNDREKIGVEKSGIMRKNCVVISGDKNPPLSIRNEANRKQAKLYQIGKDFSYEKKSGNTWVWKNNQKTLHLPCPSLKGVFQLNNAATVIAGLTNIKALLPVSETSIKMGLVSASIVGRLQLLSTAPKWLVDVAHNPHSAKQLAQYLKENPVSGRTFALFSMLKDKDIQKVIQIMNASIDEWHIIGLGGSRGLSAIELKQQIMRHSFNDTKNDAEFKIITHDSISTACMRLNKKCNTKDRVVAFGSFLVVSDVMTHCNINN